MTDIDLSRANFYAVLARLLEAAPDHALLARLAAQRGLTGTALETAMGALSEAAAAANAAGLEREYHALFIGLAQGELLPYGSYYLTGFLNEKPLAELRTDMARLGIAARPDRPEPEDHVASLCDMMAGLITGAFGAPADLDEQRRFFAAHLAPWAARFFDDLAAAPSADFYAKVAALGRAFVDIEQQAFSFDH